MRRGWFLLLALSLGLNAGLAYTVIAQRHVLRSAGPMPPMMGPGGAPGPEGPDHPGEMMHPPADMQAMARQRLERVSRWLDLDDRQSRGLGAVLEDAMPRIMSQRDSVRAARRRAAAEYLEPVIDPERVRIAVRRLNTAQAQLDSLVSETMSREAALLTPEQRARYFAAMPWGPHSDEGPARGPHRRMP
jgi:Spy/CpxP family protein refolding chaperone